MSMFISDAWAQAAAPVSAGASAAGTIIQIVGILLVFYLILIRPQSKKMKLHEEKLKKIEVGDEIVTGGGLYAKVTKIENDDITAEIAKGVEVKMYRYTIREALTGHEVVKSKPKAKKTKAK